MVPLFEGPPPDAILDGQRPFKDLSDMLSTTPKDRALKKSESTIPFSKGSSAIVVINDQLLSSFTHPPLSDNPFTPINTALLDRLSASASRESSDLKEKLEKQFTYDALLSEEYPALSELIPILDSKTTEGTKNTADFLAKLCQDFTFV